MHINVTILNFSVRIILKKYKVSKEKNVIEFYAIRTMVRFDNDKIDRDFTKSVLDWFVNIHFISKIVKTNTCLFLQKIGVTILKALIKGSLFCLYCLLGPFFKLQSLKKKRQCSPIDNKILLQSATEIAQRIRKREVNLYLKIF